MSSAVSPVFFKDFEINPKLLLALDAMGFNTPTPIQDQVIPTALTGKDILGCAQTGTGKTGAFGVPLVSYLYSQNQKSALILAPTRELAEQIYKVIRELTVGSTIRGAVIVGGASMALQIQAVRRGVDFIVATPGRLIDLMEQRIVNLTNVGMLVLDEVDRMLDMGFIPQLRQIMKQVPADRQTMLFSATFPREIQQLAETFMRDPLRVTIGTLSSPVESVEQAAMDVRQDQKNGIILQELKARSGKILVFTRTKHRADRLAYLLQNEGHSVEKLHGGRSPGQRRRALEDYRNGVYRILVATDLAGRGIDIDDIEHVINYDMPATHEDYVHRIGRTGRAGKTGKALNLVTQDDSAVNRRVMNKGNDPSPRTFGGARPSNRRPSSSSSRRPRTASR